MSRLVEEFLRETHLKEQLIPAKIEELYLELTENKELEKFLTTKAKDLPEEYRFLVTEISEEDEEKTLLNIIETSFEYRKRRIVNYFSKAGEKIVGFVAYFYYRNEVTDIKMFSFYPDKSNVVLLRDLRVLLKDLLSKYERVFWSAVEKNPANVIYRKVNEEFGGKEPEEFYDEKDHEKKVKLLQYCIESKTFQKIV